MSWNIGDSRKLRFYPVVLTTPKTSPEKLTVIVVEMQ